MAIDTANERLSATNLLIGLRILFPTGSIDQANRQAAARTISAIYSIAPIVFLDSGIDIKPAINATTTIELTIESALSVKPAIKANMGINQ